MKKTVFNTAVFTLLMATGTFAQTKGDGSSELSTIDFAAPTCANMNDGWITITPNENSGPQTILWNTNETTMSLNGLSSGTYIYTLTNTFGQSLTDTIVLSAPAMVNLDATVVNPTSNSAQNGSIIISDLSGSNFSYNWSTSNGSGLDVSTLDQTSLGVGSYKLIAENENGCTTTKEFNLVASTPLINDPVNGISGSISGINNQHKEILVGSSPFKGKAHIMAGNEAKEVEIYNQKGEKMNVPVLMENKDIPQLVDLEAGYYVVVVHFTDGTRETRNLKVD